MAGPMSGTKRKLFESPKVLKRPRKTGVESADSIERGLFFLPQEVLDTSRGKILQEFMKDWEKNLPSRRNIFDLHRNRDESVEVDEERFKRYAERNKQRRAQQQQQEQVNNDPVPKQNPKSNSSEQLEVAQAATRQTVNESSPVRPVIKPVNVTTRESNLRRSVLRAQNDNRFQDIVASTPCDANNHPLNYSSVSPISTGSSPNKPRLTILAPNDINSRNAPRLNILAPNDINSRNARSIRVLNEVIILPNQSSSKANTDQTPPGAIAADQRGKPKNLSKVIDHKNANLEQHEDEDGLIARRNENFESGSSEDEQQQQDGPQINAAPGPETEQVQLVASLKQKLPALTRSDSSSSADSVASLLIDNFDESILPRQANLSRKGTPLLMKTFKEASLKSSEVSKKFDTFAVPKAPPNGSKGKKKNDTRNTKSIRLYFDSPDESSRSKSKKRGTNSKSRRDTSKRSLYTQQDTQDSNDEENVPPSEAVYIPCSQPNDTQHADQTNISAVPPPPEFANKTIETNGTSQAGPSQSRRSRARSRKSAAVQATNLDTEDDEACPPQPPNPKPDRRSNAVQTSRIFVDDDTTDTEAIRKRKTKAKKVLKNVTNTAAKRNKKTLIPESEFVESVAIVDGVRKSKRTKYLRTDGRDLIPLPPDFNYKPIEYDIPRRPPRPKKKNLFSDASDAESVRSKKPKSRGRPKKSSNNRAVLSPTPTASDVTDQDAPQKRSVKENTPSEPAAVSISNTFRVPLPPTSPNLQQKKSRISPKVVVEPISKAVLQALGQGDAEHSTDSGLVSGLSHLTEQDAQEQGKGSEEEPVRQHEPAPEATQHEHQNVSDISQASHHVSSQSNASQLVQWTNKLLNATVEERDNSGPTFQDLEKEFDVIAQSEDVDFVSYQGVDYASYKGEYFKNSGYIRLQPNVTKTTSRAKKFNLRFLVISGGPVEFTIGKHRKAAPNGSQIYVVKDEKYGITNNNDHKALLFFYKTES